MASRIVSLVRPQTAPEPAALGAPEQALARRPEQASARQHVWRGASGRCYDHSVYSLVECPPLPAAGYVLVRRDEQGRRTALRVDIGSSDAPTLNLARVRQSGAQAGANEVHVRFGATSTAERQLVACDLRTGLFGTLAAGPDAESSAGR